MLIKENIKSDSTIQQLQTEAGSIVGLSNVSDLLRFERGAFFLNQHADKKVSNLRRSQLAASDSLLEVLVPDTSGLVRENGKPFLINSDRHISISHTGANLSMIIGKQKVAIDIEPKSRSVKLIEHKFLNERDKAVSSSAFPENPSLLVWCVKECLFKFTDATGVDFRDHLQLLEFEETGSIHCSITHPSAMAYLRVHFTVINELLIATIG